MKYVSTRGEAAPIEFSETVLTGLARDGGLLIPELVPDVSDRLHSWRSLPYQDLAVEIMRLFTDIPSEELRRLVQRSYSTFDTAEVTPIVAVDRLHILELFHGPTLAFKDIALQFLGNLFERLMAAGKTELNILAATSGDTGSAAIRGVTGRERIRIFVMFPHGRISKTQEHQMTTVLAPNVFTMAVKGTFDDCQKIMKTIFNDLAFRDRYNLGAVNSINWARILAQIVYYFYAAFRVIEKNSASKVRFSVPTGNFGDILAGYYAARMGAPISLLVLATNENDILSRFFNTGIYSAGPVRTTISPSMDIQVASNFERYLFYKVGHDPSTVRRLMAAFSAAGELSVPLLEDGKVDSLFAAGSAHTADCLATISAFYTRYGYLMDPHTAVGVHVAMKHLSDSEPMICLATAHPAKFGDVIAEAIGRNVAVHPALEALLKLPSRCDTLEASVQDVKRYLQARIPRDD